MAGTICGNDGDGTEGGAHGRDSVFRRIGRTGGTVLWRSGSVCEGISWGLWGCSRGGMVDMCVEIYYSAVHYYTTSENWIPFLTTTKTALRQKRMRVESC